MAGTGISNADLTTFKFLTGVFCVAVLWLCVDSWIFETEKMEAEYARVRTPAPYKTVASKAANKQEEPPKELKLDHRGVKPATGSDGSVVYIDGNVAYIDYRMSSPPLVSLSSSPPDSISSPYPSLSDDSILADESGQVSE